MTNDKEKTVFQVYGFPIWLYPVFILVIILFAVCTEWDPAFGKFRFFIRLSKLYHREARAKLRV